VGAAVELLDAGRGDFQPWYAAGRTGTGVVSDGDDQSGLFAVYYSHLKPV
jgi:hypothetical protein